MPRPHWGMKLEREENACRGLYLVVPSLNPCNRLLDLLAGLRGQMALPENAGLVDGIVVVNDGSGPEYDGFFETAQREYGCKVLRHAVNLGKGRALKTAFNHCLAQHGGLLLGTVTLDADGQHAPEDVMACARLLAAKPDTLVLGSRNFDEKDVPFKSRAGNKITRQVFRFLCGVKVTDTQTGLRGIPAGYMRVLMNVPGERFEFEMNMLIECREAEVPIREVPIQTIYLDDNRSSHFNPLRDAVRVYSVFLKYVLAGLSSLLLDMLVFILLAGLLDDVAPASYIMLATVGARIVSSLYNYLFNRNIVFKGQSGTATLVKYYVLVVVQMLVSGGLVTLLDSVLPLLLPVIKIIVDFFLFLVNFQVQRGWVFAGGKTGKPVPK